MSPIIILSFLSLLSFQTCIVAFNMAAVVSILINMRSFADIWETLFFALVAGKKLISNEQSLPFPNNNIPIDIKRFAFLILPSLVLTDSPPFSFFELQSIVFPGKTF